MHGLNITRNQECATMADVNTERLENRKPILKKKKAKGTISSVGSTLAFSMDGHDKLNCIYQSCTFSSALSECMDTAGRKLFFIWLTYLTVTQFILCVGILSIFMIPKNCWII